MRKPAPRVLDRFGLLSLVLGMVFGTSVCARPFTVADDIALQVLHEPCATNRERVVFSPNGLYFFVFASRGRTDVNQVEETIRIYRTADVDHMLEKSSSAPPPAPVWVIQRSNKQGPVIGSCRWTADSKGVAFLERSNEGDNSLEVADVADRQVIRLSLPGQLVGEFDVRDTKHYVYRVAASAAKPSAASILSSVSVTVTGESLPSLLMPETVTSDLKSNDLFSATALLWAAMDGKPFQVTSRGTPLTVSNDSISGMALSPDGREVATAVPLEQVPGEWETSYTPPVAAMPHRIRAGAQDVHSYLGAHQYVRIDLTSGAATALSEGPTAADAGWTSASVAQWSGDGTRIALTASYVDPSTREAQKPCITVVDLKSNRRSCVLVLREPNAPNFFAPWEAEFVHGDPRRIKVTVLQTQVSSQWLEFYEAEPGRWRALQDTTTTRGERHIWVKEGLSQSPLLMASRGEKVRVVWDPNPQLKNIDLGKVSVYRWRDATGRPWAGGLYEPPSYRLGERYPLVIQTHGFHESDFNPAGIYSTGNAAQALAGLGVFVLQVPDNGTCHWGDEAQCAVAGYDAAVKQLSDEGKIDPHLVGIEGFSWTCLYVTQALSFGTTRYRAASITDGVMWSYLVYLTTMDNGGEWPMRADRMFGPPLGDNLTEWVHKSPIFNLDRSEAALQVVALGKQSLLYMWEPYAVLHYLHRPVDAVLINTSEHVLTNPNARLASQEGEVDWFRFWLKKEEDSAPEKQEQYVRWRALRDQEERRTASATQ